MQIQLEIDAQAKKNSAYFIHSFIPQKCSTDKQLIQQNTAWNRQKGSRDMTIYWSINQSFIAQQCRDTNSRYNKFNTERACRQQGSRALAAALKNGEKYNEIQHEL